MDLFVVLLLLTPLLLIYFAVKVSSSKKEINALNEQLKKGHDAYEVLQTRVDSLADKLRNCRDASKSCEEDLFNCRKELESLKKYSNIRDINKEFERIKLESRTTIEKALLKAEKIKNRATEGAESLIQESKSSYKKALENAKNKIEAAEKLANVIEQDAIKKAEEIAGDAWEAKQNADQYSASVKAMKNIIKGYGDEYLIPNHSLLDDLATEYDHTQEGEKLAAIRTQIKSMIKNDEVADCDYVETYRKTTAKEFIIDAYNGKVSTIMAKVKAHNYGTLKQELEDAYRLVNYNGKAFRDARILERYADVISSQLKQAVVVNEVKLIDREEQRQIKQQMREEARAIKEYEKAIKDAEKEEKMLQKALTEARRQLQDASNEQKSKYEQQLLDLQGKLTEAEEKNQRALSMAQQTRMGHVYIISNIGSFGENIFKIGMTRRLEPLDRVKELGDASVPFKFDVHAMIHSDDAPLLEKTLHTKFLNQQVNKVNPRKEFFNVKLSDLKLEIESLNINTHWTLKSEALEYRESLAHSKT